MKHPIAHVESGVRSNMRVQRKEEAPLASRSPSTGKFISADTAHKRVAGKKPTVQDVVKAAAREGSTVTSGHGLDAPLGHSAISKSDADLFSKVEWGSSLAGLMNVLIVSPSGEPMRHETEELGLPLGLVAVAAERSEMERPVLAALIEDFAGLLVERAPRRSTMTEDERAWLIDSGAMTAEEIDEAEKAVAGGALSRMELRSRITPIATALSTKEVADRLQIDETRVRHRLAKDGLYSIKVDGRHRFPEWQFAEDTSTLLPGLKQVIQALPDDLDPASVEGLMTSEQDNLLLQGAPVTPREWLQAGGSVDDVIDVIEGIEQ